MTTTTTTESPEARLMGAGFARSAHLWLAPGGQGTYSQADAIAGLASGEIQPGGPTVTLPSSAAALPDELVERMFPKPSAEPPAWLLAQAEVIAQAVAEKMKPLIRAEVRAALRAKAAKP